MFVLRMHITRETDAHQISGIGKTEWKSSFCAHTPSQQDIQAEELADSALEKTSSCPTPPSGFTIPQTAPHIRRPSSAVYCFMLSPPYSQPTRTLHEPQTAHNNKSVVYCEKFYESFRLILSATDRKNWLLF